MDRKEETLEWKRFAEMDLNTAEFLRNMNPVPLEIICYHCQQAAEKYLKSFLVYNNVEFEKIHNLAKLCKSCFVIDKKFDSIVNECIYLNAFSTKTRYPDDLSIEEHHVVKAIKFTKKIKILIEDLLIL